MSTCGVVESLNELFIKKVNKFFPDTKAQVCILN